MRPIIQPKSSAVSPRSWPELPAATVTARPPVASCASIQRVTAALPSCEWPLVPRLMLIEIGRPSSRASVEQVVHRVDEPARVVERQPLVEIGFGQRDQHGGDVGPPADAAIAGGDARDVRAVRSRHLLRLRLELGGRQSAAPLDARAPRSCGGR